MKSNSYYNQVYKHLNKDFYSKEAHEAIREWRSYNIYTLSRASRLLDRIVNKLNLKNCYTGQRLKRLVSIKKKIAKSNGMRLTKMQDIVGVRLVVNDLGELARVIKLIQDDGFLGKNLSRIKEFNYLKNPKSDGYRSYHVVFELISTSKGVKYKRLFELQVRTKAQHAWSTVVETIGTFLNIDFKGGEGDKDWKNFFKKSSYMFSWFERFEVGNYSIKPSDIEDVIKNSIELKEVMIKLRVRELLTLLNNINLDTSHKLNRKNSNDYAIILIDYIKKEGILRTFPKSASKTTNKLYMKMEEELSYTDQIQVLFVEITDLTDLRKAFPNFYIDVSEFIQIISRYFEKLNNYTMMIEDKL